MRKTASQRRPCTRKPGCRVEIAECRKDNSFDMCIKSSDRSFRRGNSETIAAKIAAASKQETSVTRRARASRPAPAQVPSIVAVPTRASARRLFLGDSGFPDHALVLGELIARHGAQFLRRTAAHREPQLFKFTAHFGIADGLQRLGIQTGNDVLRSARGSQNCKP